MATVVSILQVGGFICAVAGMIYLRYRRAKWYSDQKDEEADIQTLFSGKK